MIGSLITPNGNLKQTFHLVDSSISLNYDGLLGGDFLSCYRASISYDTFELKLHSPVSSTYQHVSTTASIGVVITELSHSNRSASIGIQTDCPNSNRLATTDHQTKHSNSASFGTHSNSASIGSSSDLSKPNRSASIGYYTRSVSFDNHTERTNVILNASFGNSKSNQSARSSNRSVNLLTQIEHSNSPILTNKSESKLVCLELVPYEKHPIFNQISCLIENENKRCHSITVKPEESIFHLPARSETIIEINHNIKGEYLCQQKEVMPGIIIGNSIGVMRNGKAKINIINITETPTLISRVDIKPLLEPLSEHDILELDYNQDPIEERISKITQLINLDHCNKEEKDSIHKLYRHYNKLFYLKGDHLTFTDAIQHSIPVNAHQTPINVRPYRLAEVHKSELNRQLTEMLEDGIIQHSKSPWNAPLLIVPKKSDKNGNRRWRVVVDFRRLNDVTSGDAFPLPNICDILDQLGNSKYFTTLDLANGFHQVRLNPADREKTAFSSNFQHFEFVRMPFGLKGAPSTFQRVMNSVLTGLQGIRCFVYMDDVVVYAKNLADHDSKIREIFDRLSFHNLKLQPEKCNFLQKEISYLGHLICDTGIKPDPSKIEAVQNFPTPKIPQHIKSFLGLAGYYRRFISDFSGISKPLTSLLKKNTTFTWDALCDEAFRKLKEALTTAPILAYPDFEKPFNVTTDASDFALGAVLSQGEVGSDRPICYSSRTMNPAETRYSTIEKELLAIVYAVTQYRPYIYGRKFTIYTDHKPLVWVMSLKDPSSRLVRWRIKLEEYDYTVIYKPGKSNTNADALSRIPFLSEPIQHSINLVQTRSKTLKDSHKDLHLSDTVIENHINPSYSITNKSFSHYKKSNIHDILRKYQLSEKRGQIFCRAYDFIIHITDEVDKLEITQNNSKFEPLIEKSPPESGELIMLNDKRGILNSPLNRLGSNATQRAYDHLSIIYLLAQSKHSKNIAISLKIFHAEKYFQIKTILAHLFHGSDITIDLYSENVTCPTSDEEIKTILETYHLSPLGGHQGVNRTLKRIKLAYYWKGMAKDIKNFISKCQICQLNKVSRVNRIPMKITTTSTRAFERVFLDIVGPWTESYHNNKYILTFQDDLTKYSEAIPIPNQEARTIAEALVTKIICRHGIPESILTDQGSNFLSNCMKEVYKLLKISKLQTTPYHPQTNGALERSHRGLSEYLRNFVQKDPFEWCQWIPYAMFVYNTTPHTTTNFTPHELVYGFPAQIPSNLSTSPKISYNYENYASELKARLQHSHCIARANIISSKDKSKQQYDKKTRDIVFKVGGLVLLRNDARKSKLSQIWTGPWEVIKINSPENTTIKLNKGSQTVHNNRLKLYNK